MKAKASMVAAVVAVLVGTLSPARAATAVIHAQSFSWVPEKISILPGDTVRWMNDDNVTHSITQLTCPRVNGTGTCLFDTDLPPGNTFSYSFTTPGVYEYQCAIHIFFGEIDVLGESALKPDLAVTSLRGAAASTTAPATLRIEATLANHSPDVGAGRSDVVFQYRTGDGEWQAIGTSLANALPAGGTTNVRILWDASGKVGDFQLRVIADGFDQVAESDETNNVFDGSTSVLTPPGLINPGVDLKGGM